jgi:protein SCO1/2
MMSLFAKNIFAALVVAMLTTAAAFAQPTMPVGGPGGAPQSMTPDRLVREIGVDQKLDAQISPDLTFKDETGKTVRLGDYFGKRPLMLTLVYFECPGLCTMTLNGVTRALNATKFTPGQEFDVLVVSFDPRDTPQLAAAKKATYTTQFRRPESAGGWHFLTGAQADIDALCQTVGFRYKWEEKFKQYSHASAIVMLTPQGRVSRYFFGLEYSTRDIELSLVEGSQNRIGSLADAAMTFCFKWDESAGKYSLAIMRLVRVGGVLTVAALATFLFVMFRRDRREKLRIADCGLRIGDPVFNPQSEIRNPQ